MYNYYSYEDGVFHYIIKTNENNQVYFENSREQFDSLSLLVEVSYSTAIIVVSYNNFLLLCTYICM